MPVLKEIQRLELTIFPHTLYLILLKPCLLDLLISEGNPSYFSCSCMSCTPLTRAVGSVLWLRCRFIFFNKGLDFLTCLDEDLSDMQADSPEMLFQQRHPKFDQEKCSELHFISFHWNTYSGQNNEFLWSQVFSLKFVIIFCRILRNQPPVSSTQNLIWVWEGVGILNQIRLVNPSSNWMQDDAVDKANKYIKQELPFS